MDLRGIFLDDKLNPQYTKLFEESNELMKSMDSLHIGLSKIKYPLWFPWLGHMKFVSLINKHKELLPTYLKWQNKAWDFSREPSSLSVYSR